MNPIVFAIVVVVVLGLAGGVILVLASKFMAVYEDPRIAQITECLAGANCGGCGYAGCADYAKAIVENGAPTFKCAPGGDKTATPSTPSWAMPPTTAPACAPPSSVRAARTAASGLTTRHPDLRCCGLHRGRPQRLRLWLPGSGRLHPRVQV